MPMTPKQIIKLLEQNGFVFEKSILKQAGLHK